MRIFFKSILIYLLFFSFALAFRASFLALHFAEGYGFLDALVAIISGLRFDMQLIGYAASVYYIFSLFKYPKWQLFIKYFYILLGAIFIVANCSFFVFFNIYGKNFDNQLFLFRNEELAPLISTAFAQNYGILPALFAGCALIFVFAKALSYIHSREFIHTKSSVAKSIGAFLVFALLMMLSINQQFHYKATSVYNTLRFTKYAAINASMPGHLKGFLSTLRDGLIIKQRKFSDFTNLSAREIACKVLELNPCLKSFNLSDVARNKNPITPLQNRPEKIFYVISESLSDWINEERFAPLWADFLHREKMAYVSALENANATARSLQAQLAGVYFNEVDNTYFAADMAKMPTNIITRARKAGYEVHFYFGGANNWAELFDFYKALDKNIHLHDKDDAIEWAKANGYKEPLTNSWGVFDDILFDYARANSGANTFNIFMTITNHPAYDLAWLARSKWQPSWEQIDAISPKYRNELATVQWYLRVIDEWLNGAKPNELYMITGDHYGRYNIDDSPDALLTHSVPIYAYSPQNQLYAAINTCNHLGIAASIFALANINDDVTLAPACFSASPNTPKSQLNIYGYEYSLIDGKLVPTSKEPAALSWYLSYVGEHFE